MVGITSLQSSIYVIFTGSDLAINSGSVEREQKRVFTVNANYNSSLGTGLQINDRAVFDVVNLSAYV
jgi:hypothetical protein